MPACVESSTKTGTMRYSSKKIAWVLFDNKELRRTARRAMSVEILLSVETSRTRNPQQIAVMELDGCS